MFHHSEKSGFLDQLVVLQTLIQKTQHTCHSLIYAKTKTPFDITPLHPHNITRPSKPVAATNIFCSMSDVKPADSVFPLVGEADGTALLH